MAIIAEIFEKAKQVQLEQPKPQNTTLQSPEDASEETAEGDSLTRSEINDQLERL